MSLTHSISVLNQNIKLFRGNELSRFIFVSMDQHFIISVARTIYAVVPPAYETTPSAMKNLTFGRDVLSWGKGNLVVFYYLNASEVCPV